MGEALNQIIPLPIPASIYGLIIMLIALSTKLLPLDKVKDVGKMLIQTMPIMFIPAGVGLITAWDKLSPIILPVVVITFISTIIVMIVSGKFTETIINKDR
ncbi:CidA/LrgA family protein [Peptostreptococcus russellii]|nr:CidA/LrgA family protein [Peptostreptococcus russellii]